MNMKEIKEIAKKYSLEKIEACINEVLEDGKTSCEVSGDTLEMINTLAKAQYVKELMEKKGMSEIEAIRELARRIRQIQGLEK